MSWYTEYKSSLKMAEVEEFFDLFFYRPLAFLLVKAIFHTNITPNQLTYAAIVVGVSAGFAYAGGSPEFTVFGAVLFMVYDIIDCSDGQLARLKKNGTHAGRIVDGLADYISTIAVFIGLGIGRPDHQFGPSLWWTLIAVTAASNLVQCMLVDYYRNRFLDYVLQRKSTFDEDLASFREEYNAIRDKKDHFVDRFVIASYLRYSAIQRRLIPDRSGKDVFKGSPQDYYRRNRVLIRCWVSIGPTTQVTSVIICSLINRFDVFFWLMIGLFNLIAGILWLIQQRIDNTMTATTIK